jgi:uncharacterized membrane-anchored protein
MENRMKMNKKFRDNVVIIMMAHAAMFTTPTILHAAGEDYNPINFTQPIKVERGVVTPIGQNGVYLSDDETCSLAKKEWGWTDASCQQMDQLVFSGTPEIDSISIDKPVSEGYVHLDDFFAKGATEEIDAMAKQMQDQLRLQSQRSGKKIEWIGWRLFPKADKTKGLIYYAYDTSWDDTPQTAIKIVHLDRYGYANMEVIPAIKDPTEAEINTVVDQAAASYKPNPVTSYSAYQPGDKVAAYGGLGVLATVLGVKYGKAASAGFVALLAIFLKKAGFVLLLPFLLLGKLFRRKRKTPVFS